MDLFFSCDIEGVSGAAAWGQLAPGTPELQALCGQMTREVAAACRAAVRAGGERILVKDAHDTGRNIALELSLIPICFDLPFSGKSFSAQDSKSVCGKPHEGSNPSRCARKETCF